MSHVIVVGGGAAGMFAAIAAAKNGHQVTLYEKNEKLGKKIFITGKGRCNITNAADMEELFDAVVTNSKFLYSSFYGYTNQNVIDFFEDAGVPVKIERGNRVFPISDHSSDVNLRSRRPIMTADSASRAKSGMELSGGAQSLTANEGAGYAIGTGNEKSGRESLLKYRSEKCRS